MFLRRPGGQSQFSTPLSFAASSQSPLNKLQVWILDHLHEPLTVEQMAQRAHMSPRNFARVFRRQFHMTPGAYLDNVRVEAARKRLEETTDTIESIAEGTGFANAGTMRRAFMRILDLTPADYRARFRGHYKAVASD
jgi:transcriptional regulator GlxA family with amidase domain